MTLPPADLAKRLFGCTTPYPANVHIREAGRFNQPYPLHRRDCLRAHPRAAAACGATKQNLAARFPDDAESCCAIKDPVFDLIIAGAEHRARTAGWCEPPGDQKVKSYDETSLFFFRLFTHHVERAEPERPVGMQRQFQALYGADNPTGVLLATLRNARPRGRPTLSDCKVQSLAGQRGIARRASRLVPGGRKGTRFHQGSSRCRLHHPASNAPAKGIRPHNPTRPPGPDQQRHPQRRAPQHRQDRGFRAEIATRQPGGPHRMAVKPAPHGLT